MNLTRNASLVERLAAAYALGTLRGPARRRFEQIARQSPAVRSQVLLWQERLASMTELQSPEAPSPEVWKRIQNLVAAEPNPAKEITVMERLRRVNRLWRGAAVGSAFATLAAVVVGVQLDRNLDAQGAALADATRARQDLAGRIELVNAQLNARSDIRYVAVLGDEKQLPSVLVTFDPTKNTLTVKRVTPFSEGDDRSLQLWALPPGGTPKSLGVLDSDTVVRLNAGEEQVRNVPALAISLEPRGGAPAGSGPTGPVLFKGALLQTST